MLEINHISLTLGKFSLKDISLQVNQGEYLVILGPSGGGKTVLLETIAGRHYPHCGSIINKDEDLLKKPVEERHTGFVYQNYQLFPTMNVENNIGFGLKMQKINTCVRKEKVRQIANSIGIEHLLERYPQNLSGGEQQRVALARALIVNPEILLLDEPLSALDRPIKKKLQQELKRIHKQFQTTTIHVTHDMEEAFYLADSVAIMQHGVLKEKIMVEELQQQVEKNIQLWEIT